MRIIKASYVDKLDYNGVHPIFGHIQYNRHRLVVEFLGEGKGEPNYEVLAPSGCVFMPDRVHTYLGTTQRDLMNQLSGSTIEADNED